jgi:hypothetical protein
MGVAATRAIHSGVPIDPHHISRCVLATRLIAFASIVTSPFWLRPLFFASFSNYSTISSLVCVPLMALAGALAVAHFSQSDWYLRRLLIVGIVASMAASSLFLWVGWFVYGGAVDAFHYWSVGLQLAERFHTVGWAAFQPPYWSTNLINNISGIAALLIGDALPTLFITFALISLAGKYLFYRAFADALPEGDRWLFGLLVVLSPSLLFWSSFIGKDSLIQYFIALTSLGFARLIQRPSYRSIFVCAVGLAGTLLIRPHIAAMLAIAMTFPYSVGRSRAGRGNKVARILIIPVLAVGTYFLVSQSRTFLYSTTNSKNSSSAFQEAETVTRNSQTGGSSFNQGASLPVRIAEFPFLMFRPFPWEIHNVMSLISAVESVGLMVLCWVRRREIRSTLRHWRDPYVGFLLLYSMVFSITFSGSISNFGLLARQRIMVTPLVLMLVCARQKLPVRATSQRFRKNARLGHVPARALNRRS